MQQLRHFLSEVRRVRWMLIVAVGVLAARTYGYIPDTSATALILHKPSLAAIGFIAAHIGYQQAFPYIDQGELLRNALQAGDSETRQRYALLYAGTCVLRGAIYAAFILGVTLGL